MRITEQYLPNPQDFYKTFDRMVYIPHTRKPQDLPGDSEPIQRIRGSSRYLARGCAPRRSARRKFTQHLSSAISILKRFINCGRPQVQVDRVLQGPQFNVFRPTDSKRSGTTSKAVETASAVTFSLGPPIRLDSRDRWPVPPFTARAQRSLTFTNATTR